MGPLSSSAVSQPRLPEAASAASRSVIVESAQQQEQGIPASLRSLLDMLPAHPAT